MSEQTWSEEEIANRVSLGQHQHVIEAVDEEGREGRWVVHRPNMKEEVKIRVDYARLKTAAGEAVPAEIDTLGDNVAYAVALLNTVVDLRPPWFPKDAGESLDGELLYELMVRFNEWRESFRGRLPAAPRGDSGAPGAA